jgi:hypothetical protein
MKPGSNPRSSLITLIVIAFGAMAWLAPAASAQVPTVTDPTGVIGGGSGGGGSSSDSGSGGVVGGVVDGVTGGSGSQSASGSGSGSGGGIVGGVVDVVTGGNDGGNDGGIVDTVTGAVKDTVDHADQASGGSVSNVKNAVDDATGGAAESSPIGNPLSGFTGSGKTKGSAPKSGGIRVAHTGRSGSTSDGIERAFAATSKAATVQRLDSRHGTNPLAGDTTDSASFSAPEPSTPILSQLTQAALAAGEKLAFPLALSLMVVAFLMVQGRIDRKDAKLVLAPIDAEQELLSFQ